MKIITNDGTPYIEIPELTAEEKQMPASRFITDYKLYPPAPPLQQILDAGAIAVEDAIPI